MKLKYSRLIILFVVLLSACVPVSSPTPIVAPSATVGIRPTVTKFYSTPSPIVVVVVPTLEPSKTPRPTKTPTPSLTPFYTFLTEQTRTPNPGQTSWRGDLHIHSGCTQTDYETIIAKALKLNFSFIAITDHHGFSALDCRQVLQLCAAESRLFCIPGEELFAGILDIIALGHNTFLNRNPDIVFQVARIHEQGGLAIAAHPLAGGSDKGAGDYTAKELYQSGFDAMECNRSPNRATADAQYAESLKYNLPCVFVSDSHPPVHPVGKNYTICRTPINSLSDLKQALIQGLCKGYRE